MLMMHHAANLVMMMEAHSDLLHFSANYERGRCSRHNERSSDLSSVCVPSTLHIVVNCQQIYSERYFAGRKLRLSLFRTKL